MSKERLEAFSDGVIAILITIMVLGCAPRTALLAIMVAGIFVVAAADTEILAHPSAVGEGAITWMVPGGAALFLAGHALFKAVVWQVTLWSRIVAIILLAMLGLLVPYVSALALGICAAVVLVGVAGTDRVRQSDGDTDMPHPAHTQGAA